MTNHVTEVCDQDGCGRPLGHPEIIEDGIGHSSWPTTDDKVVATTKSGKLLTEANVQALADEAEAGYDISQIRNRYRDIPALRVRAMVRLLYPDDMTPWAKRQFESLIEEYMDD